MVPCTVRPLRTCFLLAAVCLAATAATPSRADEEGMKEAAKFEAIARADTMIMVPMRDGTGLATDVYLPKDREGPFPVIFVKTPYDFNRLERPARMGYRGAQYGAPLTRACEPHRVAGGAGRRLM